MDTFDQKELDRRFLMLVSKTGIVFDGFSDLKVSHFEDYQEMINLLRDNTALLLISPDTRVRSIATFLISKRKLLDNYNA
jgi:hypothetical protein